MGRNFDAIVIGAGFGGLYALHKLRELGFRTRVVEAADGVGGTWYWNRYPGARVDVEGIEYSYSFSRNIEREWDRSETMPAQPEIERYLNFVADRLDLRRDIQFETRVVAATYDEAAACWSVETDTGETFVVPFVIAATGCLSEPLLPNIEGRDSFAGTTPFTSRFPREGFDFSGQRVTDIGTDPDRFSERRLIVHQARHYEARPPATGGANTRVPPTLSVSRRIAWSGVAASNSRTRGITSRP